MQKVCAMRFVVFILSSLFSCARAGPDNVPIVQVRLAPPAKPFPEVAAEIGLLEEKRDKLESEKLRELQQTSGSTLRRAKQDIDEVIRSAMQVFEPTAYIRHPQGPKAASFLNVGSMRGGYNGSVEQTGGFAYSLKLSTMPAAAPDMSVQSKMDLMENKRSNTEQDSFVQAHQEILGLSDIVLNELGAQLQVKALELQALGAEKMGGAGFLALPKLTQVRLEASDEPFPRIAEMVQDMEIRRDTGEQQAQTRVLELETKLLQAENAMIKDSLAQAIQRIIA